MKIGRNKPCPCGSGKKHKHCHGRFGDTSWPPSEVSQALQRNEAKLRIKEVQQGLGRPIVSLKHGKHQIVAVGSQIHYSSNWKTFIDFLGDYIKRKLPPEWGNSEIKKPLADRHPIMQWYEAVCRIQADSIKEPGQPASMEVLGALASYYGLAYALYLIDHNVDLQDRLIARLKDRSNFQGAYYELVVARALILAGFSLTLEDESDRGSQHCEFSAISIKTGKKYWIEAKMRSVAGIMGKTEVDGATSRKAENPISKLINHLSAALRKPADSQRMIFIDINTEMPVDVSIDNRPGFIDSINRRLQKYEKESLEPGKSAYLFITNMTFHRNLLGPAQLLVYPWGLGIPDFNRSGYMRLSEIYRRDLKHSDALSVAESMQNLLKFPTTFDASMPASALFGEMDPIQIGERYEFEGARPDGGSLVGVVTDAMVDESKKEVVVCVQSDDGKSYLLREKMTNTQYSDYDAYRDVYFGQLRPVPKQIETPYELFLLLMNSQRGKSRSELLRALKINDGNGAHLSDEELLMEYCERQVVGSGLFEVVDGVLTGRPVQK